VDIENDGLSHPSLFTTLRLSFFNLLFHRLEKAEKVEKEESLAVENQRRPLNQDQLRLDYR
jgi:hypothetical protein